MPSEQTNHHEGDNQVEDRVGGRHASFDEEWERRDLESVGGDGDGPRHAMLGVFQRFEWSRNDMCFTPLVFAVVVD